MPGNGESKLCVKESKLCSWNCCWRLLCEGPGEVPPAPRSRSLSQSGCECERARVKSGELVTGLCCASSVGARALLPDGHRHSGCVKHQCWRWPRLSWRVLTQRAGAQAGELLLPGSGTAAWYRCSAFAFLWSWSIPLPRGRNRVLALPVPAG